MQRLASRFSDRATLPHRPSPSWAFANINVRKLAPLASDFVGKYTVPFAFTPLDNSVIMQRRDVYFSGHVQGVGFRYSTMQIARRYDVTGFVENLTDGRVHLVLEGLPAELDGVLRELKQEMGGYIRQMKMDRRAANGEFTGFEIRH